MSKQPRVFVIADLHLCHDKILENNWREFRSLDHMHDTIIERWYRTVLTTDTVYVLGDVAIASGEIHKKATAMRIMMALPGRKILIAGNHDYPWIYPAFEKVMGCFERKRIIMTHIPVHTNQKYRFRLNIHGHLHNKVVEGMRPIKMKGEYPAYAMLPDPWYVCVSCEQVDYTPKLFSEIIEERIQNERDER